LALSLVGARVRLVLPFHPAYQRVEIHPTGSRCNVDQSLRNRRFTLRVYGSARRRNHVGSSPDQAAGGSQGLGRTCISLMLEAGAPPPYVMDQVGRADSKTTLEIYAQVQKRISRQNVHAAFDRLLTAADSDVVRSRL
jgi:hypothetical protein